MQNSLFSWDSLAVSADNSTLLSSFLSQQSAETYSAARHLSVASSSSHLVMYEDGCSVNPAFSDPTITLVDTTVSTLFHSLCISMTGVSSPLYVWDRTSERFTLRGTDGSQDGLLVISGMDQIISQR